MQVEDTRNYRVAEVAEHFNVSVSTIYRVIESGQLDALRLGTAVRVPGWAVRAYTDACYDAAGTTVKAPTVPAGKEGALTPRQADGLACTQHDTDDAPAEVAR
ncbi:MAG: helix-turn-helix domain-containing protein [Pseudonocardiales bacterium]|nr:helix-turn-helix domain-containing protein [Pseudonocardiales bacterium]